MNTATNPFVASEVLVAERLLEAFDTRDPRFGDYFEAADRVTLGALVAYASFATRELAARTNEPINVTRKRLRSQVVSSVARTQARRD
jgi:hypothetical protein